MMNDFWLLKDAPAYLADLPKRRGVNSDGVEIQIPSIRVDDGTAIIPIKGVFVSGVQDEYKDASLAVFEDIKKDIVFAMTESSVKRVVLDINSPGGTYNGTPEIAAMVAELAKIKPVAAFTSGLMASATYWIGTAAGSVYMAKSASVGSIGAVRVWRDYSKMMEADGIKTRVFSSGKYKGITPEVEMSEDQEAYMQSSIESIAQDFYSHVKGARVGVNESAFDGRIFLAEEAEKLGLIDGIAQSIDEVINIMTNEEKIAALETSVSQMIAENQRLTDAIKAVVDKTAQPTAQEGLESRLDSLAERLTGEMTQMGQDLERKASEAVNAAVIAAIAQTGQPGPVRAMTETQMSASERTDQHYINLARQLKGIE